MHQFVSWPHAYGVSNRQKELIKIKCIFTVDASLKWGLCQSLLLLVFKPPWQFPESMFVFGESVRQSRTFIDSNSIEDKCCIIIASSKICLCVTNRIQKVMGIFRKSAFSVLLVLSCIYNMIFTLTKYLNSVYSSILYQHCHGTAPLLRLIVINTCTCEHPHTNWR